MPPEVKPPSNIEIEQALKEFQEKSGTAPSAQSAQVPIATDETPKMVGWVMKLSGGAIKEERQAGYVLLGFAILLVLISVFLFFNNDRGGATPLPYDATYKPL